MSAQTVAGVLTGAAAEPRASGPVLQLSDVSKVFGHVRAVDHVSLEVVEGEVLTLLGPSGCGKTTTLRMVIGLERCTEGQIAYQGRVVDSAASRIHVPTHKREMGMVFQSYAIWPHMTVFENVAYPLRVRRTRSNDVKEAVRRVLELVGLAGLEDRPATMLSGGQQQRVALARSLVFEPKILLLDEPFSNLDAKLREQMRAELRVLQRRLGITVLFVTHDQTEALGLSDRIAVMNAGRVEQVGTPHELYLAPNSPLVRDFVGRTIVLEGRVSSGDPAPQPSPARGEGGSGGAALWVTVGANGSNRFLCGASDTGPLSIGQACYLAIRPEQVLVEGAPSLANESPRENQLPGIIEALLFVGERYEAQVRLPWGESILIYLPPTATWSEDQEIRLTLPRERIRVWPA